MRMISFRFAFVYFSHDFTAFVLEQQMNFASHFHHDFNSISPFFLFLLSLVNCLSVYICAVQSEEPRRKKRWPQKVEEIACEKKRDIIKVLTVLQS